MVSAVEVELVYELFQRAQKRLSYQERIVSKLGFDSDPRYADTVLDIYAAMQGKVDQLRERHAKLVAASAHSHLVGRPLGAQALLRPAKMSS